MFDKIKNWFNKKDVYTVEYTLEYNGQEIQMGTISITDTRYSDESLNDNLYMGMLSHAMNVVKLKGMIKYVKKASDGKIYYPCQNCGKLHENKTDESKYENI